MLIADLEGYERTLAAERRNSGIEATASDVTQTPLSETHNGANHHEINKAEFARRVIRESPNGLWPREILRAFERAGIPIGKPYIYALVQRLQKQGVIRQRRDKWYPVPHSERTDGANGG